MRGWWRGWIVVWCAALATVLQHGRVGETYNVGGDCERRTIDIVRIRRAAGALAPVTDRRVRLVRNATSAGVGRGLQQLLEGTDSRYVARMDADDLMHRDRLRHPGHAPAGASRKLLAPTREGAVQSATILASLMPHCAQVVGDDPRNAASVTLNWL